VDVITATPGTTHPGGSVDLRTFASCPSGPSVVTSPALAAPAVLSPAADGGLYAEGTVAADAADGSYPLTETCQGRTVATGRLSVSGLGALEAGGGWGAARAAVADPAPQPASARPTAAEEYLATGLTAAACLAAVLFAYQRRRTAGRG
jgi:hypothetical protein